MPGHDHPAGDGDVGRTVVVDEAPRADQRALAVREAAPHEHGARPAERHLAAGQDDGTLAAVLTSVAGHLGGLAIGVAHVVRVVVAETTAPGWRPARGGP